MIAQPEIGDRLQTFEERLQSRFRGGVFLEDTDFIECGAVIALSELGLDQKKSMRLRREAEGLGECVHVLGERDVSGTGGEFSHREQGGFIAEVAQQVVSFLRHRRGVEGVRVNLEQSQPRRGQRRRCNLECPQ